MDGVLLTEKVQTIELRVFYLLVVLFTEKVQNKQTDIFITVFLFKYIYHGFLI